MIRILIILGTAFLLCSFFRPKKDHVFYAERITKETASTLSKRHNMSWIGEGGAMMKNVEEIMMAFEIFHPISKDEARKMIVDCTETTLQKVNSDEKLRPFLKNYPFKAENVFIIIHVSELSGDFVFDPEIGVVSTRHGIVYYKTHDPENIYRYKSKTQETYEEAKSLVAKPSPHRA